jgi:K+-transporting ATPase ATPase C chain
MRRDLVTGLLAVVVLTIFLGVVYPLAVTGVAQVIFPGQADGSLVKVDGRVVGSSLIGQEFKGRAYFHSRPSATEYSGNVTFFGNVGPNSKEGREEVEANLKAYLRREAPYDHDLQVDGPKTHAYRGKSARRPQAVPVDAVTQSASGVDPHISQANAWIQAHRVAAVRGLPLGRVEDLISAHTDGRFLGLLGEPGVNVLELNLALDQEAPIR